MLSTLRTKLHWALVCTISLLATVSLAQTTINVGPSQPYSTIQSGIDAAADGDTVLVAPGTYYENIDFKGKAITVTSSGGAPTTIIDGGQKAPTVLFKTAETRASVLSGFTIQHGGVFDYTVRVNGGIFLQNSSPTIRDNVLTQNNCWTIYSQQSAPLIQHNEISATQDPIGNCTFGGGAGVYISGNLNGDTNTNAGSSAMILGNTIENNVESGLEDAGGNGGAAIAVWGGSPVILNNILRNNSSPGGSGGAINVEFGQGVAIVQNLIYGNSAGCGGGALAVEGNPDPRTGITALIANNSIANNTSSSDAGFTNCIAISQIYPSPDEYGQSTPAELFINNIVSGSTSYPAVNCSWFQPPGESDQPTFQNDILYNGGGPFFGSYCIDVSNEYNNIPADPQFVSPSTGNFHVQSTSPAIDTGQNSVFQTFQNLTGLTLSTDLDGQPRPQDTTGKGCIVDMGAYEYPGTQSVCSTTEALTSSPNPSTFGQTVTFTAQLSSASGVPTGDVQFSDAGTVLGTEAISGTGVSTFSTSDLSVGSHNITATFQPTGSFPAASASITQVVNGSPTNIALTCSPASIYISQTAHLAAVVTSVDGTPTGSINFTDDDTPLDTAALAAGAAALSYTGSSAGAHTLTATYVPTGSFSGSSASCSETVNLLPSTSTLSVNPATSAFGSPVTLTAAVSPGNTYGASTPTGTVTFSNGGSNLGTVALAGGTASLTLSTLPGGSDSLTCTYGGSTIYASSACNTVPFIVNAVPTATSLTVTPNPAYVGQTLTLAATVAAQGTSARPGSGSVTFYDGATSLGTVPVGASSTATLTISTLSVGTHPITATFSPANNTFVASTSPVVNVVILASGFTIALSPGNITLERGASATVAIQLASVGNFAGPLSLTYGALPADATASINPATLTLTAGGTGSSTLTLNTLFKSAHLVPSRPGSRPLSVAFAALALLFIPLGALRRRKLSRLLALASLAFALQTITGCTNAWYIAGAVAPGTYQLPVIATDANHNTQTATLTITVTP